MGDAVQSLIHNARFLLPPTTVKSATLCVQIPPYATQVSGTVRLRRRESGKGVGCSYLPIGCGLGHLQSGNDLLGKSFLTPTVDGSAPFER